MKQPPTGEPYAGKPLVRFGGRGGATLPDPYWGPNRIREKEVKPPGTGCRTIVLARHDNRFVIGRAGERLKRESLSAWYVTIASTAFRHRGSAQPVFG